MLHKKEDRANRQEGFLTEIRDDDHTARGKIWLHDDGEQLPRL
jgi:hypothetical protein